MQQLVNCISSIRKYKNLTQRQLADAAGVSTRTLRKWENGSEYPRVDQAFLMAGILEIPVTKLFFYTD